MTDSTDLGLFGSPPPAPSLMHTAGVAATNLLPGLAAQFLPDRNAQGAQGYIPGIASGLYSTADVLGSLGQRAAGVKAGDMYHLPGGERASELSEGSAKFANDVVPHMEPQSPLEHTVQDYSNLVGSLGVPIPGTQATGLGKVARVASHALLPGPVAAGEAVGLKATIDGLLSPSEAQAAPTTPSSPPATPDTTDTTQPASSDHGLFSNSGTLNNVSNVGLFNSTNVGLFGEQPHTTQAETDPTSLNYGKGALIGLGAVAVLGAIRGLKLSPKALAEAKYPELSAAWNAETAANGGVPKSPAPLPGGADSAVIRTQAAATNENAPMQAYLKGIAPTPEIGEQWAAKYGDITGAQPQFQRYQAAIASGDVLGHTMPSPEKWYKAYGALDKDTKKLVDETFASGNEIDNRTLVFKEKLKGTGVIPTDEATRVGMNNDDLSVLHANIARGMANPQAKAVIDMRIAINDAIPDMLVKNGMIDVATAQKFRADHRWYLPTSDLDNLIVDPLKARDYTPGSGSSKVVNVADLYDQHLWRLFQDVENNRARNFLIQNGIAYQGSEIRPGVMPAKLFEYSRDGEGNMVAKQDGSSIPHRDNGELLHTVVNNRYMLDAMNGPAAQTSAAIAGINKFRQFQQSFITGPGAIAAGHVFPAINAIRSVGEISAIRPSNMYGTLFDKWMQRSTGNTLALRGDPISGYAGMLYHMVAGGGAEAMRAIGSALENTPNSFGSRMRLVFGDSVVDAMSNRAQAVYNNSWRADMRENGMLNSAGMSAKDVSSNAQYMSRSARAAMPSTNMVPEAFNANTWPGTNTVVHLRNLFDEMRSVIGDAAHTNFYALNKDNPRLTPEQLRYETRQITGDPGTRGGSAGARAYGATVPFGNIALQEVSRVMRAFNEEPIGATLGYITHYGTLAAASVFTAMLAGPEAIKDLFDSTTDQQRSHSARLYVPGSPTTPVEIPHQIMMRGPYNMMVQLMHDAFSLSMHSEDPDLATQVQHIFMDLMGKHVTHSTVGGTVSGFSSGMPPLMPSVAGPAITALTGKTVDPTLQEAYLHGDKPISKMFGYDIQGNGKTPGEGPKTDPLTGTANGLLFKHIASDIMGMGGVAIYNMMVQAKHVFQGKDTIEGALSNIMSDYKQRFRDDIPGGNLLWGGEAKQQRTTPLEQRVEESRTKMQPLASWKSDTLNYGLTRPGGQQLIDKPDPNIPKDPTMRRLYDIAGSYYTLMESSKASPMKSILDARKQIEAVERTTLSPEMQRSVRNQYEKVIQDKYQSALAIITKLNDTMSNAVGTPVDIRHIDFTKGPEQFH